MKIKILKARLGSQGVAEPSYQKLQKSKNGAQDLPARAINAFLTYGPDQQDNEDCIKQVCVRKVRLICTDPEATDSSSDEEDVDCNQRMVRKQRLLTKRIVREVPLPPNCCYVNINPTGNTNFEGHRTAVCPLEVFDSRHSSIKKRRFSLGEETPRFHVGRKAMRRCDYIGVRQSCPGKWSAEFKDPAYGTRHWLGTYNSARAAAMAYDTAARRILGYGAITNFVSNAEADGKQTVCGLSSSCRIKTASFKEGHGASFKEDESTLCTSYLSRENDTWLLSSAVDDCSAELLPVCLDFDCMEECILSPRRQRKLYGCLLAASPSSVLEHDMPEDCTSADKCSLESGSDECDIEISSLLGCVAAKSSILVRASSSLLCTLAGQSSTLIGGSETSESFQMESKDHSEVEIAPLLLDELSVFGQELDDLFTLEAASESIDIPVTLQDGELFKEFPNCQGDLSGMDFELDSEELAWIDIPAM